MFGEEGFEEYKKELTLLRVGDVIFLSAEYESVMKEVTIFYTPWEGERVIEFLEHIRTFPRYEAVKLCSIALGISWVEAQRLLRWVNGEAS